MGKDAITARPSLKTTSPRVSAYAHTSKTSASQPAMEVITVCLRTRHCPPLSKRETIQTITASARRSPRRRTAGLERRNADYITFFNDPGCEEKVGSDSHSTHNSGCFENGGAYANFPGDDFDWHIEQYASVGSEQCTGQMTHCIDAKEFAYNSNIDQGCRHLNSIGLMSGYGSYKIGRAGCP